VKKSIKNTLGRETGTKKNKRTVRQLHPKEAAASHKNDRTLQDQLKAALDDAAAWRRLVNDHQTALAILRRDAETIRDECSSALAQASMSSDATLVLSRQLSDATAQLAKAQAALETNEAGAAALRIQLDQIGHTHASALQALNDNEAELSKLRLDVQNGSTQRDELFADRATAYAELTSVRDALESKNKELSESQDLIARAQHEQERDRTLAASASTQLAATQADVEARSKEIDALRSQLDQAESRHQKLSDLFNALEKEKELLSVKSVDINAQLELAIQTRKEASRIAAAVEGQLAAALHALKTKTDEIAQAREILSRERQKNAELFDDLDVSRKQNQDLRGHLTGWLHECRQWEQDRLALESTIARLNAEVDAGVSQRQIERQTTDSTARQREQHIHDLVATQSASNAEIKSLNNTIASREIRLRQLDTVVATQLTMIKVRDDRTVRLHQNLLTEAKRQIARKKGTFPRLMRAFGTDSHDRLDRHCEIVSSFLAQFDEYRLGTSADGRHDRILQYLLGLSEQLDDFLVFDAEFYLSQYPDVRDSNMHPFVHFVLHGAAEYRKINVLFDQDFYLAHAPEVLAMRQAPIIHYIKWGADKQHNPHILFDTQYYYRQYPELKATKHNPLLHFLKHPGYLPHPLFDSGYYLSGYPDIAAANLNPLVHFLTAGADEHRNPHPLFDTGFYITSHSDVSASMKNPLSHFIECGAALGYKPNPQFDPTFYSATHPDVGPSGLNPLIHYINVGRSEGRAINAAIEPAIQPETSRGPGKQRVLMIDALYPRPDQDSGSNDQISFIKLFRKLGYEVSFAADLEYGVHGKYRDSLENLGVTIISYDKVPSIETFIQKQASEFRFCFLSRVHFGGRHLESIRAAAPDMKIIFNTVDLHFLREQRQARLKNDEAAEAQAAATKERELHLASQADATIVVSQFEKQLLGELIPRANIHAIPLIREFRATTRTAFEDRSGIAFVGGYLHEPNIDAVEHFLDDIWPAIRSALPDVTFYVIGSNLPDKLAMRQDSNVSFVGYVRDLDEWLARLRLTVAPLRSGAGAKGKVVSSLAQGTPCIASPIAAEGMGLSPGTELMVGHDPQTFADEVISIYQNKSLWEPLANAGFDAIRERYSLLNGERLFQALLSSFRSQ
jgi:glycosyltransferase involved in cell wall biosynthesis